MLQYTLKIEDYEETGIIVKSNIWLFDELKDYARKLMRYGKPYKLTICTLDGIVVYSSSYRL